MATMLYSSEALAQKKALSDYFDTIKASLDEIAKVSVSDTWQCSEADNLNTKLVELQGMISSIKNALTSYDDFFGLANTSYESASNEIEDAVSTYING